MCVKPPCKVCGCDAAIGRAWMVGGGRIDKGWYCQRHDPGRDTRLEVLCSFCDEPVRAKWTPDLVTFRCEYHQQLHLERRSRCSAARP